MKERRVELAIGQIAGAAEDDKIERFDLDNACGHDASFVVVEMDAVRPKHGGCRPKKYQPKRREPSGPRSTHRASACLTHRILKQNFSVASEILDQRQRRASDRTRVGPDRARDDLDIAQASPIEAVEDLRRAAVRRSRTVAGIAPSITIASKSMTEIAATIA